MRLMRWLSGFVGGIALGWGFGALIKGIERADIFLICASVFCLGSGIFAGYIGWILSGKNLQGK